MTVKTESGFTHKLLMTEKEVNSEPTTPVALSDPFKIFDWHMKSKIAKLAASRIRIDDFDVSDCSSILCDEREWEMTELELAEWELAEWEEYLND